MNPMKAWDNFIMIEAVVKAWRFHAARRKRCLESGMKTLLIK